MNNSFFHKVWEWLKSSHRLLHILIGIAVGFGANSVYCASYTGAGIAVTSELKDKLWGGEWDWVDLALTIGGVAAGYTTRALIFGLEWY